MAKNKIRVKERRIKAPKEKSKKRERSRKKQQIKMKVVKENFKIKYNYWRIKILKHNIERHALRLYYNLAFGRRILCEKKYPAHHYHYYHAQTKRSKITSKKQSQSSERRISSKRLFGTAAGHSLHENSNSHIFPNHRF